MPTSNKEKTKQKAKKKATLHVVAPIRAQPVQTRALKDVTKKQKQISEVLPTEIKEKLDSRLQTADKATADQITDLLHFSRRSRDTTSQATRLAIRTALTVYLAHGGAIQDAGRLKEILQGQPGPQLNTLLKAIKGAKGRQLVALSKGPLSSEVTGLVANVAKHSPKLANRLHELALREIIGDAKPGITQFMATRAQSDQFMADHTSPLVLGRLPTAASLGLVPKFHIKLTNDQYKQVKELALRLQGDGVLSKLRFDNATKTVHMGYTYQTLSDICGGLNGDYRADGKTIPLMDGRALKGLLAKDDGKGMPRGLQLDRQFGNPSYQAERQKTRFQAVYDMYDKYNDFDFPAYDIVYSDKIHNNLANTLQGKTETNQITDLLSLYDGFTISDEHGNAEMKQVLYDNLAHLAVQNVKVIGIEHLKEAEFGDLLREYYAQPSGTPMSKDLEAALNTLDIGYTGSGDVLYGKGKTPKSFRQIVEKAKQLNMQLVPLDTENNNPSADKIYGYEVRAGAMNMFGERQLRDALNKQPPGSKYVLLAGAAHNNTHVGLTQGMPGFAQMLEIPAVTVIIDKDADGKPILNSQGQEQLHLELDLEDKAKRRPATGDSPN